MERPHKKPQAPPVGNYCVLPTIMFKFETALANSGAYLNLDGKLAVSRCIHSISKKWKTLGFRKHMEPNGVANIFLLAHLSQRRIVGGHIRVAIFLVKGTILYFLSLL